MEAMDCEINTVSTSFKNKEKVFDEKNYLNIRLSDNQTTKELKFRLLPIDGTSNTPFKKIHVHTVKVPKEVSPSGWKSYICIEKTEGIDRNIYGSKCPFCEMNREAYKKFSEETEPAIKERWKKISLENIPKGHVLFVVLNVVLKRMDLSSGSLISERIKQTQRDKLWNFIRHV